MAGVFAATIQDEGLEPLLYVKMHTHFAGPLTFSVTLSHAPVENAPVS